MAGAVWSVATVEQHTRHRRGGAGARQAKVRDTTGDPTFYFRIDGQPAVGISLIRAVGSNALRVANAIKGKVGEMEAQQRRE